MKTVIFSVLCAFLFACTTFPPPRIENGVYINKENKFTLDIPEGWSLSTRTTRLHDALKLKNIDVQAVFVNEEGDAIIAVVVEKRSNSQILPEVNHLFGCDTARNPQFAGITERDNDREFPKIRVGINNCCYIYDDENTCFVSIALASIKSTYAKNYENFLGVTRTINTTSE